MRQTFNGIENGIEKFKQSVKGLNDRTHAVRQFFGTEYKPASIVSVTDETVSILTLNSSFIEIFRQGISFSDNIFSKFTKRIKRDYFDKRFPKESIRENDFILLHLLNDGSGLSEVVMVSDEAYKTLLMRLSLSCEGMLRKSLARNIMLADAMERDTYPSTVVYRTNNAGYKKIEAVLSERYAIIPQILINDIMDEFSMGYDLNMIYGEINDRISSCYLTFMDKTEEIKSMYDIKEAEPGIYLATSDTGDCSVTAKAFFRFRKSIVIVGEVVRKHEGKVTKEEMVDSIINVLFPKFTIIPEKLLQLMSIDIDDPEAAIRKVLKYANLVKMIGKKNEVAVTKQLIDELNPALNYTAYDIARMILEIPERIINISIDAKSKLENGIIKSLDYDYSSNTNSKSSVAELTD